MKKTATVLSICLLGASVAQAALIVSPTLNNGSFELDDGGVQVLENVSINDDMLSWTTGPVSGSLNGESIERTQYNSKKEELVSHGVASATIGNGSGLFLDTGYMVAEGDVFTLSLDWFPAGNWTSGDTLEIYLYTTDGANNKLLFSAGLAGVAEGDPMQTVGITTAIATSASAGKNLLMEINSTTGKRWARVDNVTIDAIPEPAVMSLIGIFGGGILISRRLFEKKV